MKDLLAKLLTNKHTTFAAGAYALIEIGQQVACTWWPAHADQIYETSRKLSKAIVVYGLATAGDAKGPLKLSDPPQAGSLTPQETLTVPIPKP